MKTTRLLACLLATVMACGAFTACGEKEESSKESSSSSTADDSSKEETKDESKEDSASESSSEGSGEEETKAPVAVDATDFEPANFAESGDAYLAMVDEQVWLQYWGKVDSVMTYDAGIADINGDGQYTVSVTTDTKGCRYDTTGDVEGEILGSGVSFMAVMIPDGETLYPGAVMTIDSIKVDGNEIDMIKKGYTSSDDGKETRVNIYNTYIKDNPPSPDARTADGALYTDGDETKPVDACADYAPCIVDTADFGEWSTVEVTFTITGTGTAAEGGAAEGEAATEAEATEAAAE